MPEGAVLIIEVPAKIWRYKVISRYRIPKYYGEDIDSILEYGQYGKCVYYRKLTWDEGAPQDDKLFLMMNYTLRNYKRI